MKKMIQFPEDFFKKEIRCGFTVSEVMKRVWAVQLDMLHNIMNVCEKYNLTCYVYWGSLLGAVRHQGYIPWDDDIDIAFLRDDYIKFLEVASQELPEEYDIRNMYTRNDWGDCFTRINSNSRVDVSPEYMEKNYQCPWIVGLDVFPLYYIPKDKEFAKQQNDLLYKIAFTTGLVEHKKELEKSGICNEEIEYFANLIASNMVELEQLTGFKFTDESTIRNQLYILYDQAGRLCEEHESDYVTSFLQYQDNGYCVDKELFKETLKMPFENIVVNVPSGYDEILKKSFNNYMKPEQYMSHDYPFFKEEVRMLGNQIDIMDMQYKQSVTNLSIQIDFNDAGKVISVDEAKTVLPLAWWDKIYPLNTEGIRAKKKVVLYYTSAGAILNHSEQVIDKLKYVFRVFQNDSDVVLWWFPCSVEEEYFNFVGGQIPEMLKEYEQLVHEYQTSQWGIYDDTGDIIRAIAMCDAYYGDECLVSSYIEQAGKMMMYQNYEINTIYYEECHD